MRDIKRISKKKSVERNMITVQVNGVGYMYPLMIPSDRSVCSVVVKELMTTSKVCMQIIMIGYKGMGV